MNLRGILAGLAAPLLMLAAAPGALAWRSALYPEDWSPGYADGQGRYLHDFSYAGYRNSEVPLPDSAGAPVFDVVAGYGADSTGAADAAPAIQAAIDAAEAAGGGVVNFPAGLYRCESQLVVADDGVVLRGAGPAASRIYFTFHLGVAYDGHIKFLGNVQWGADLPLAADGVNQEFAVRVADASSLAVGQEVAVGWVITPDFIAAHGMTGTWTVFLNQWKPVFRRRVVALDLSASPHVVTLDVPLRYPALMRDAASVRPLVTANPVHGYVKECGIEDLGLANAVLEADALSQNQVAAVQFRGTEDCWARNVRSFASPLPAALGMHLQSKGISVEDSNRVTVADCRMELPQHRGGGGNGYLIEITRSNEVLVRDTEAVSGRHNLIQNWDFGTTGCVFLRCLTSGGSLLSEYHHSLAMACLVDSNVVEDGWFGGNRRLESSGAGHTVTESVFWNSSGGGLVGSWNYGWGYVIGTSSDVTVITAPFLALDQGTAPEDYREGEGLASTLEPQSLFEDQLARRLAPPPLRAGAEWKRY